MKQNVIAKKLKKCEAMVLLLDRMEQIAADLHCSENNKDFQNGSVRCLTNSLPSEMDI